MQKDKIEIDMYRTENQFSLLHAVFKYKGIDMTIYIPIKEDEYLTEEEIKDKIIEVLE